MLPILANQHPSTTAAGYLMTFRTELGSASFSGDSSWQALSELRSHLSRLDMGEIAGSNAPVQAASDDVFFWKKGRVAARIRGIEQDLKRTREAPESYRMLGAGRVLRGVDQIRDFHSELATSLENVLSGAANAGRAALNKQRLFNSLGMTACLPILWNMAQIAPEFYLMLGATLLITEPYALVRQALTHDHLHAAALAGLDAYLKADRQDPKSWRYDAANYALHQGLIKSLLHPRTTLAQINNGLAYQVDLDRDGPFIRNILRPLAERHNKAAAKKGPLDRPNWAKPAWIGIDRLLRRDQATGEPLLTVFVRASVQPPRYPSRAKERQGVDAFAKMPELVPLPVRE